jgi:hypothetical protein
MTLKPANVVTLALAALIVWVARLAPEHSKFEPLTRTHAA